MKPRPPFSAMRLSAAFGLLLLAAALFPSGVSAQTLPRRASEPVRVEARLAQAPGPGQPQLRIEFGFDVAPGVHVYADEAHFFTLTEKTGQNLGPAVMQLPPTQAIPDLLSTDPRATVPVFAGHAVVTVVRPVTGSPWRYEGTLRYQACSDTMCFPPKTLAFQFDGRFEQTATAGAAAPDTPAVLAPPPAAGSTSAAATGTSSWAGHGLLWGVLAAFGAGLALSLTPCVYPMIGITVAVIGGGGAGRGRRIWLTFWYVLGLALVYAAAGVLVALLGSQAAGFLRSAWVLVPVGVIFLLLGLSMFDVFTLATPTGLASRLQGIGKQGSVPGVLVMGALSAFVVGPCVSGPLLSLVTFVAASGEWLRGFLYFFALAWGMGAVLFLAGSASGLLPHAGPWMETVKHALGMVLVWGAVYFTRPLLGETLYHAATLTCAAAALGILGWLRLPDAPAESAAAGFGARWWPRLRLALGIAMLGGVSWLVLHGVAGSGGAHEPAVVNLPVELAAAQGRPVLLDFTAPWCANCRVIERETLAKPDVQRRLAGYRFVEVDYDRNPELVQRFGIIGPPAFVFLDAQGNARGATVVTGPDLEARLNAAP